MQNKSIKTVRDLRMNLKNLANWLTQNCGPGYSFMAHSDSSYELLKNNKLHADKRLRGL